MEQLIAVGLVFVAVLLSVLAWVGVAMLAPARYAPAVAKVMASPFAWLTLGLGTVAGIATALFAAFGWATGIRLE